MLLAWAHRGCRVPERVGNRVDHGGRRADRTRFTAAFYAERIVGACGFRGRDLEAWQIIGAWQCVIHQAAGDELSRVFVVDAAFEQRLAYPLSQTPMDLTFHDHRIDHLAEVVDRGETRDAGFARFGVDLDFADVRARWECEVRRIVKRRFVQSRFEFVQWVVVRHIGRQRDLRERDVAIGACDGELAVLEFDIGFGCFEQVGGDLLAFRDDLVHRAHDGGAADSDGP